MTLDLALAALTRAPLAMLEPYYRAELFSLRQRSALKPQARTGESQPGPKRIALLNVSGPIVAGAGWIGEYLGWTDPDAIAAAHLAAAADPDIAEIITVYRTPGGSVLELDTAVDAVRSAASKKPVTALVHMAASAGLWIASQSSEVVTTRMGVNASMGVITAHADWSKWLVQEGIDLKTYRTGDLKALGQMGDPNDEAMDEAIRGKMEKWLSQFAADVGAGRRMTPAEALNRYALNVEGSLRGDTVIGAEAVVLGLADRVGTLPDVLGEVSARVSKAKVFSLKKGNSMDKEKLLALLESGEATPEQVSAAIAELQSADAKAHGAKVAALLGVAVLDDATLARLKQQAADGAAYRDSLLERVHKATIQLEGNDAAALTAADRMKKAYAGLELADIKAQAEALEMKVTAAIPNERRTLDKPQDAARTDQADVDGV